MDVSVIIVNYNTADLIKNCIASVLMQKNISLEIIVVDNASKDNSLAVLEKLEDKIRVIANKDNLGFGKANNQGFKVSSGKTIFLLNPDAVLASNNVLETLLNFMEKNTGVGIVGPRVMGDNKATQPQTQYPGQSHLKKPLETLPGKIAWIIGASMFIRREVYEKMKGFDEDYFLYGEEADLCLRVRRAGWMIDYVDDVTVEHMGHGSERTSTTREYWVKKQAGIILFYKKNYGLAEAKKLIQREIKKAKLRLFMLKFIKDAEKQGRYEAILAVSQKELLRASLLT
ncbi:MAG TPA: glycosyltransferase family 2 protein [Gammaproteobacteria bacterium]|nr:glycosyltransferase family 2 protein [Gammaproteobacteria bacterium]